MLAMFQTIHSHRVLELLPGLEDRYRKCACPDRVPFSPTRNHGVVLDDDGLFNVLLARDAALAVLAFHLAFDLRLQDARAFSQPSVGDAVCSGTRQLEKPHKHGSRVLYFVAEPAEKCLMYWTNSWLRMETKY